MPLAHLVINEVFYDNYGDPFKFSSGIIYYNHDVPNLMTVPTDVVFARVVSFRTPEWGQVYFMVKMTNPEP